MRINHSTDRACVILALSLSALLSTGCAATRVDHVWRDPGVTRLEHGRLLVVVPYPDGVIRRTAEDAMRAAMPSVPVVTSYDLIAADAAATDANAVLAVARRVGADAVITARLIADHTEIDSGAATPYPATYATMHGYWGLRRGATSVYVATPTVTTTRHVAIEMCIHRVADGRLVWTALMSTRNPDSLDDVVTDSVAAARERLIADGLVQRATPR